MPVFGGLNAHNASAYLTVAAAQLSAVALDYRRDSEHSKLADAMDRAIDRAQNRTAELV